MTVEELLIKIRTDTSGLKNQVESTKKSLHGISNEAEKAHKKLNLLGRINWGGNSKSSNKLQREIDKQVKKIEALKKEINSLGDNAKSPTPAFKNLTKDLDQAKKKMNEANDAVERMIASGRALGLSEEQANRAAQQDKSWAASEKAYAHYADLIKRQRAMIRGGDAYQPSKEFISLNKQAQAATEKLKELKIQKRAALKAEATNAVKRFGVQSVRSFGQAGASMKQGIRTLLKYSLGIRGLFILFNRLRSAVKEGFNNLSQFSGQTSTDLAMLRGSLTQVKNSLATAFAPIVTVIAPLIQTLVNYITTACNALAMFFGALTGQKTVSVAKTNFGDIAAGAAGAADATGAANGAAEAYQRTLMGFDQINKLDDNSGSGGGGGAGGGVGGAAGFTTSEISNAASGWADKVKEAWKNADFTEIGATIADKINKAMDKINWDSIKEKCNKVAKSVGTFINGFVAELDWGDVGYNLSQGFITAINMISTFLQTVDWRAIGSAVVKFFAGIDWAGLFKSGANLLGSIAGAIGATITGAVSEAWTSVKDYFGTKIEEAGGNIIKGVFKGILDGIKNIGTWIKENIFQPFIDGFKKAFGISSPSKVMEEMGGYLIDGLKKGITGIWGKVKDKFVSLKNSIVSFFKNPMATIKGKVDKSLTSAKTYLAGFKNKGVLTTLKGKLASTIKTAKSWFSSFYNKTSKTTLTGYLESSVKTAWNWFDSFYSKSVDINLRGHLDSEAEKAYSVMGAGSGTWTMTVTRGYKANGGLYSNGSWKPITAYAGGGAPNMGQMFVAREAGPELVGTIGGHTAVMNNDQIVASVAAGVARAVASVMGSGNNQTTVVLEGDARKMFKVIRQEAQSYTNSTGLSAFPV